MDSAVSRRTLLGGAVAFTGLAGLGTASCSTGGGTTGGSTSGATGSPAYRAYTAVPADLPGTAEGVMNAYLDFPTERPVSVPDKVGSGETITALVPTFAPPPTPLAENSLWQNLNQSMGVTLDATIVGSDGYPQRLQTTFAGNDIPDMVCFGLGSPVPETAALLEARFTNLSEYLAGDLILEYPNLANIPAPSWEAILINGAVWGIPLPRTVVGGTTYVRSDIFASRGIDTLPDTLDGYTEAVREVTDAGALRWGIPDPASAVNTARLALGSPNVWRESGGKFEHEIESPEYLAAIEWAARMWSEGLMHPDGVAQPGQLRSWFYNGQIVTRFDSFGGWRGLVEAGTAPGYAVAPLLLGDSGTPRLWTSDSTFGWGAIKAGDEDHVRRCLRLANYLAAPFGTQEFVTIFYGEEGVHHKITDKGPELTDRGLNERSIGTGYLAGAPESIFISGRNDLAREQHEYQSEVVPNLLPNAARGLFSNTFLSARPQLNQIVTNGINDVVTGRKPVKAWTDEVVPAWRAAQGDTSRQEFEQAFADR